MIEGTRNCIEVFSRNAQEFEQAFSDDVREMCDPARPGAEVAAIKTMKAPLSLSNYHEVKVFIRYLILKDHKDRFPGSKEKKIRYGDPSWKPSFWPDNLYCWVTNKKNFSDVRNKDFPGNHSLLDVLREAIKRCLEAAGLDPEQHYDKDNFTNDIRKKRARNRGLHNVEIVGEEQIVVGERMVDEEENDDPSTAEPIPFIPRRPKLYDNNDGDDDIIGGLEQEEEEISHNEAAQLNDTYTVGDGDDGDELEVDRYIADRRAAAARKEQEEEEINVGEPLRRPRRNILEVSYSLSNGPKSDISSESASSYAPSNESLHNSTESDISSQRVAKRNIFDNSIETDISSVRRTRRIRKKKTIFDNSENLLKKAKRRKRVINESLEKLIRPPSPSTQRKEDEELRRQRSFEKRLCDQERAHEEEMAVIEKSIQDHREEMRQKKELSRKIKEKADKLRKDLKEESLKRMFQINLKYFKNLQKGLVSSWRHDLFYKPENQAQNERFLLHNSITQPFSDSQQEIIFNEVRKVWLKDQKMQMENNKYVQFVLLPEIFITIYQKFFCIGSKEVAEQYMRDPGSMDPREMSPEQS